MGYVGRSGTAPGGLLGPLTRLHNRTLPCNSTVSSPTIYLLHLVGVTAFESFRFGMKPTGLTNRSELYDIL